jgi:hypothetical protein
MSMIDQRAVALLAAIVVVVVLPATAMAQSDPADAQYGSTLEQISQGGGGGGGVESASAGGEAAEQVGGGLPFTGLDVAALALVAVVLAGAGLVLHRHSRGRSGQAAG